MTIKEAEAQAGITKKNIRFYERMGLLCPVRDRENSYRNYSEADVERLKTIRLLRSLYLPIEEIRALLAGEDRLEQSLREHAAHLAKEAESLQCAQLLCTEIAQSGKPLDVDGYLERLNRHEQAGVRFMNLKKQDTRRQYIFPAICAAVMLVIMGTLIGLFIWGMGLENRPPLALALLLIAIPASVVIGVILALIQRIREIKKGEIDEARKY